MIDADEALVGLQALGILRGETPLFYPGQGYGGSFESYLVAGALAPGGASRQALKLVPLLFSLAAIPVAALLARAVYGGAAGLIAALLVALAPLTPLIVGLKAYGGYAELPVLGGLALLLITRLGRGSRPTDWGLSLGLLCGFGLWVNLQFAYYLLAALSAVAVGRRALGPRGLAAFAAGLVPGLAALAWGALPTADGRATTDVVPLARLGPSLLAALGHLATDAFPALVGARPMIGPAAPEWVLLAAPLYLGAAAWAALRLRRDPRALGPVAAVLLAPLGFAAACLTNGNYDAIIPDSGLLVRYLAPIYLPLAVLVAGLVAQARLWRPLAAGAALALALAVSLGSVLGADLVAQSRSPYSNVPLPPSNRPLIELLDREGLDRVYASHWIGHVLTFETSERIIASDYLDRRHRADRFPAHSLAVDSAPRPAWVLFNPGWDRAPPLERALVRMGIAYQKAKLDHFLVYYDLSPPAEPALLLDSLVWPYWD